MSGELQLPSEFHAGMVMTAQDREGALRIARRIEEAGFDAAWVGDHISFHIPILESLTLLSFLAAATERIRLGTSVYLVPLRHPTTTAKVTATLDVLSGGRLAFGVGVGGEFPPEFEASGVPVKQRGARTDEGIEILRKLWRGEKVGHEGRHFRFGPVRIDPAPIQPGGPPILVGGRKAPSFRRAGRLGDGYISHMCSPEMFARQLGEIAAHNTEAGRGARPFETHAFLFTVLDESYEAARDRAAAMLGAIYRTDFKEAAGKYCLLGRPEDCLDQIRAFARAGVRSAIFSPLMDPDTFADRAGAEILPHLAGVLD